MVNATASHHAHLRVMFANELDILDHVFVKRAARHATTIAVSTERGQIIVLHMNREVGELFSRIRIADDNAIHACLHKSIHDGRRMCFGHIRAELCINGFAVALSIAVFLDFRENLVDKGHVKIEAVLSRIRAAHVNFDVVCHAVSDGETFDDVLDFFVFVRKARSFGNGDAHAHASPMSGCNLSVRATCHRFNAIVIEAHAVVNSTVFFNKSDTRSMRISFADVTSGCPDGDAAKAHVGKIANAKSRLVCTSRKHNRSPKMERIRAIGKRHHAIQSLAQVRATAHERDNRGKAGHMLQGIMAKFRIVVENATNESQDAVAHAHVIFVVDAIIVHG